MELPTPTEQDLNSDETNKIPIKSRKLVLDSQDSLEGGWERIESARPSQGWVVVPDSDFRDDGDQEEHDRQDSHEADEELSDVAKAKRSWRRIHVSHINRTKYHATVQNIDVEKSVSITDHWLNIEIPATRHSAKGLKYIIRRGVPDLCRPIIWSTISEAREYLSTFPDYYERVLDRVYGEHLPEHILKVPTFGGKVEWLSDHPLNNQGIAVVKRVLCALAIENPQIEYVPVVVDVACALALFVPEDLVYVSLHLMLKSKERRNKKQYFFTSRKETSAAMLTLMDIIKRVEPKVNKLLKNNEYSLENIVDGWLERNFFGTVPYQTALRIMDCWLNEGRKVTFRYATALLGIHAKKLKQCKTEAEIHTLLQQSSNQDFNETGLAKRAYSYSLSSKRVQTLHKSNKNRSQIQKISEPMTKVYYRPRITFKSAILAVHHFELIWSWLPDRYVIQDPFILYDSSKQGYSLTTFLSSCGTTSPTLLVLETKTGDIFGAFITDSWVPEPKSTRKGYFGGIDSFVWRMHPIPTKYAVAKENNYIAYVDAHKKYIQIGADEVSISLDEDLLKGTTNNCLTFDSPALTSDGADIFECAALEVFSLN